MKTTLIVLAFLPLLLTGCGGEHLPSEAETQQEQDTTGIADTSFDYDTLTGLYSGNFGGSELRLVITYASEGHATGFNSVKGLQRNISGKVIPGKEAIALELSEPGDDKNDGVFYLSVDRSTLAITGTWKPNNPKLKTKTFQLERIVIPEDEDGLTAGNFTRYFYFVEDSLARIFFEDDGLCRYEYISESSEQAEDFSGTWSYRNSNLTIEWQENPVFPSRKSTFATIVPGNDELPWLEGEGRKFEVTTW